jgi:hypothetical protein
VDELRVIIGEEERTTAHFIFSSQMRPCLHEFRIYGPRNGLIVDQDHQLLIKLRGAKFKSYADMFIPPMSLASQHLGNLMTNVKSFLGRDFHMKAGMKCLIETFYNSIVRDTPVPIPYREILVTARIMEDIFDQLGRRGASSGESDVFGAIAGTR